jgi:hypothetical protein
LKLYGEMIKVSENLGPIDVEAKHGFSFPHLKYRGGTVARPHLFSMITQGADSGESNARIN